MKILLISELIVLLENIQADHGDLQCFSSGEFIVPTLPEVSKLAFSYLPNASLEDEEIQFTGKAVLL